MSLNRRLDKENVAHQHKGILCSCLRNGVTKFAGKCMESEKNQPEWSNSEKKAKYGIIHLYVDISCCQWPSYHL